MQKLDQISPTSRRPKPWPYPKSPGEGGIYSLSIRARGKIDGDAEISLLLNGAPYRTEHITGVIAF